MFVCVALLTWDAKIDQLNERATNARNTSWQWSQCSHCADHTNVCEYNIARCKWLPFSHLTSNLPALCLLFLFPPKHEWKIQVPYRFPPLPSTFHLHFFYALHLSKGNSQQNSTEYSRQEEKISLVLNFEKYKKGKTSFHDAKLKEILWYFIVLSRGSCSSIVAVCFVSVKKVSRDWNSQNQVWKNNMNESKASFSRSISKMSRSWKRKLRLRLSVWIACVFSRTFDWTCMRKQWTASIQWNTAVQLNGRKKTNSRNKTENNHSFRCFSVAGTNIYNCCLWPLPDTIYGISNINIYSIYT